MSYTKMNNKVIKCIINDYDMQTAMFYMVLLSYRCKPISTTSLAKECNTSLSTIKRWLRSLSSKKYIVITSGTHGEVNKYEFPQEIIEES